MVENKSQNIKIPKRILRTLLNSLTAGVVPRFGAPYIAIGRQAEVESLLDTLDDVAEGGASVRFLIGRYGSGKTFLLQLLRGYALERDFLCADADLSPERRLSGGNGCGLATYRELLRNLACKASPEGGALPIVLSRYYAKLSMELTQEGILPESDAFLPELKKRIYLMLSELEGGVGGFDFARVLGVYFSALSMDAAETRSVCLRWLRGEFTTKTEARAALGFPIGSIIDDNSWYGFIKLWSTLAVKLGYRGLLVSIDECVNLYKIPNRIAREANYEKLLSIFNDTLEGRAKSLCFLFGGTAQFLEDTRRGLFSYEALKSRLSDSRFAEGGYTPKSAPVIRLRRLSDNELLALIRRLSLLHCELYGIEEQLTPSQCETFLKTCLARAGAEELVTPREIIRDFLSLLDILRENPAVGFDGLMADFLPSKSEEAAISPSVPQEPIAEEIQKKKFLFDITL